MAPRSSLSSLSTQLADAGTNSPSTRVPEGLHPDEGGTMFPVLWFLFHHLRARGGLYRDPGHRGWRDWDSTNGEMRSRGVVREGQLLLNCRHAPHVTARFFAVLREGLETWMETATVNTQLFVCCYSSLARDKGEHRDIGFGTKEHMAKVLADINFDKMVLIILFIVCLKLELFPAGTLPICGAVAHTAKEEEVAFTTKKPKKSDDCALHEFADKESESHRIRAKITLHFCTLVLADEIRRRRMATIVLAGEAWQQMHFTEQKVLTSGEHVGFQYTMLAMGRYNHRVHKARAVLVDPALLDAIRTHHKQRASHGNRCRLTTSWTSAWMRSRMFWLSLGTAALLLLTMTTRTQASSLL